MERVKNILLVAVVLALVAPAMASVGQGADWTGAVSSDWGNSANWGGALQNASYTTWGLVNFTKDLGGGNYGPQDFNYPVIDSNVNRIHGSVRVYGGYSSSGPLTITQTGGFVRFVPGSNAPVGLAIYSGGWPDGAAQHAWNISGGTLEVVDQLGVGYDLWGAAQNNSGSNAINISGDGTVKLVYGAVQPSMQLLIGLNSQITIADQGLFVVDPALKNTVDGYITSGRIVGIGNDLTTYTDNDGYYVVSIIPEPATMALLGLGAVLSFRRKR